MTEELDFTPGRWAVHKSTGYIGYRCELRMTRIDVVTPMLVKTKRSYGDRFNQTEKRDVLATTATESEAATLVLASGQIQKAMEEKKRQAEAWAADELSKLLEQSQ